MVAYKVLGKGPVAQASQVLMWGLVLQVLMKEGQFGIHFLKGDPSKKGDLPFAHFRDRYFEQLPCNTMKTHT